DNSPNIQLVKADALKDDLTSILSATSIAPATSATPATPVEESIDGQRCGESDNRLTDEQLEGLAGGSAGGKKDEQAADALRVVGNLPYNISVHLIEKFLILANFGVNSNNLLATNQDHKNVTASNTYISVPDTANRDTTKHDISPIRKITDMHFLVQKEIAQRLYAEVGDSNYGRLSIMVQVMARGLKLFNLPPSDFSPPPKVTSSFISLQPQLHPAFEASASGLIKLRQFNKLVTTAFSRPNRRMRNTLGNYPQIVDALEQLNLHTKRAKETSLEEFISITKIKDFSIED
nr:hypothetical protein [Gammaproteobacteria bacterium]